MEKFRDLPYQRPDMAALKKGLAREIGNLKAAKSFADADAAFLAFDEVGDGVKISREATVDWRPN